MSTKLLMIVLVLVLAGGSSQNILAQGSVTLDHVDGLLGTSLDGTDTLQFGVPIRFYIRFTNNYGIPIIGSTNGFRITSPNGAIWAPPTALSLGTLEPYYDAGVFTPIFSGDGSGADTIGFGGSHIYASGIPNGFDTTVLRISTQLDVSQGGKTLILDSSFYRPGNSWLWVDTFVNSLHPSWDGPHVFVIENPGSVTLDHVDGLYGTSLDGTDTLNTGVPIDFYIRFTSNYGFSIKASVDGFRISSPDWAVWSPPTATSQGSLEPYYDGGVFRPITSGDGQGADTIGFAGVAIAYAGLPTGFNAQVLKISTQLSASEGGRTLILDSSFFRPGNKWVWIDSASNEYFPSWSGQHSFVIRSTGPVTYHVTNLNDAGIGSLRWAIIGANGNTYADSIVFDVSGTISPAAPLPVLTNAETVINGYSAPGGAHSVIIDGSGLSSGNGFSIQSHSCKIVGLTIRNFPGNGIVVIGASSVGNSLTDNLIYKNGLLGIDLGNDGVTINDPGDLDTGPNNLKNYPEISLSYMNTATSYYVDGQAGVYDTVWFYVAHPGGDAGKPADPSEHGEAYMRVGSTVANGQGWFEYYIDTLYASFTVMTALAIDSDSGNTSEFSKNFTLVEGPLVVISYSPVNIRVIDPVGNFIGMDPNDILQQTLFPASYYNDMPPTQIDSVVIPYPIAGQYTVVVIPEADAPVGAKYSIGIRIDGSDQAIMILNATVPAAGTTDTIAYSVTEGWHFKNGDANDNGVINALDVTFLINYLYKHGAAPFPLDAGDANCNGKVNALDVTNLINFLYKHGPAPCQL